MAAAGVAEGAGAPRAAEAADASRTAWLVLATVMVGTLLVGLDRTIINLAIPEIIDDFGVSVSTAGWLGTAYIISDAVFIPVFAKLGDLIGARRVHQLGLAGFLFTSLLCGFAPTFWTLVAMRVLQGLVGAAVFPTALSLIAQYFTDEQKRTQAFGIWSAAFAVSIALGPLVGGPLIDNLDWRWIFYINIPICIGALFMLSRFIPYEHRPFRLEAFDWLGSILIGASLTAGCLVLERGEDWGWDSTGAYVAYACIVGFGVAFVLYERRIAEPLVAGRIFGPRIISALLISFVTFVALVGTFFLIPVFTQQFLGYEATGSGVLLLPFALALMVTSGATAGLKVSPRILVALGTGIAAVGIFLLSSLDIRSGGFDVWFPLLFLAVGFGLGIAPLTSAATDGIDPRDYGMASGVLNLTRNIAAAIGIAVFGTLLDRFTEGQILDLARGTVVNDPAMEGVLPRLIVVRSQVDAYGTVFAVVAAVMFAGVFLALTLPNRPPAAEEAPPAA